MKNTTIYGLGALVIIAGAGFLYFKNKKTTSLLETALTNNAGTSNAATSLPTKPPLSSTINPSLALTSLDLNIAALPGSTTLSEIQPLIQQQQIANAQAEIEKQHEAEFIAQLINLFLFKPNFYIQSGLYDGKAAPYEGWKKAQLESKLFQLGYRMNGSNLVKL